MARAYTDAPLFIAKRENRWVRIANFTANMRTFAYSFQIRYSHPLLFCMQRRQVWGTCFVFAMKLFPAEPEWGKNESFNLTFPLMLVGCRHQLKALDRRVIRRNSPVVLVHQLLLVLLA